MNVNKIYSIYMIKRIYCRNGEYSFNFFNVENRLVFKFDIYSKFWCHCCLQKCTEKPLSIDSKCVGQTLLKSTKTLQNSVLSTLLLLFYPFFFFNSKPDRELVLNLEETIGAITIKQLEPLWQRIQKNIPKCKIFEKYVKLRKRAFFKIGYTTKY